MVSADIDNPDSLAKAFKVSRMPGTVDTSGDN